MMHKLHIIVGGSKLETHSTKYRRNRLAEFLSNQPDTDRVIWVYPVTAAPRKPFTYFKALKSISTKDDYYNNIKLFGLADIVPGRSQRIIKELHWASLKKLCKYIEYSTAEKYLWFTYPIFSFLAQIIQWDKIVYDCSDLWLAQKVGSKGIFDGLASRVSVKAEKQIISNSDVIFATSEFLVEHIRKSANRQAILVENGVDIAAFKGKNPTANDLKINIPKPRFGFVGGMKNKIDFSLVAELADTERGWSIVLVGSVSDWGNPEFEKILNRKNIYWLGEVATQEVASYMHCLDVGLLPYKDIEYNRAVFPIKLFEYLAAGLPVIGCGLPSTDKYAEEGIYKHVDANFFLKGCQEVLAWSKNDYFVKRRKHLAQSMNWETKFNYIYKKSVQ